MASGPRSGRNATGSSPESTTRNSRPASPPLHTMDADTSERQRQSICPPLAGWKHACVRADRAAPAPAIPHLTLTPLLIPPACRWCPGRAILSIPLRNSSAQSQQWPDEGRWAKRPTMRGRSPSCLQRDSAWCAWHNPPPDQSGGVNKRASVWSSHGAGVWSGQVLRAPVDTPVLIGTPARTSGILRVDHPQKSARFA